MGITQKIRAIGKEECVRVTAQLRSSVYRFLNIKKEKKKERKKKKKKKKKWITRLTAPDTLTERWRNVIGVYDFDAMRWCNVYERITRCRQKCNDRTLQSAMPCVSCDSHETFSPLRTKQSTFRQGERSQKVSPFACPEPALRSRVLITSQCDKDGGNSWNSELFIEIRLVPVPLMEFMCLVFTHMPGKNYSRRLRSLLLCLRDVFWAPVNSLACSFLCYLSIAEIWNKPGETTQGRNTCL